MTLRHTLIGSLVATGALLLPFGAQAQRYYSDVEVYRAPAVVVEPAPPADTTVTRYWDSDRQVWVERRIVDERYGSHWVPGRRVIDPDGRAFYEAGHWEHN
jgi:hypothetical protein